MIESRQPILDALTEIGDLTFHQIAEAISFKIDELQFSFGGGIPTSKEDSDDQDKVKRAVNTYLHII